MLVSEVLEKAAHRLAVPGAWTQKAAARDLTGCPVMPRGPLALCWCMVGAITASLPEGVSFTEGSDLDVEIRHFLRVGSIVHYNDHPDRTQEEVVIKLREAAMLAKGVGL